MIEEKNVSKVSEDAEQMAYLLWETERDQLKQTLLESPRLREEYRLARRLLSQYKGTEMTRYHLCNVLDASFLLDLTDIDHEKTKRVINAYFNKEEKTSLLQWKKEQKMLSGQEPIAEKQDVSPLFVFRLFARASAQKEPDDIYPVSTPQISTMELPLFFEQQATKNSKNPWNSSARKAMDRLALDETLYYLVTQGRSLSNVKRNVWKEMHEAVISQNPLSATNALRFSLIGRAAQILGIKLGQDFLSAHQKKLDAKPNISKALNQWKLLPRKHPPLLKRIRMAFSGHNH